MESAAFLAITLSLSVFMTWVSTENKESILAPFLIHFLRNFVMGLVYPFGTPFMVIATLGLMALTWTVVRQIGSDRTQILGAAAD